MTNETSPDPKIEIPKILARGKMIFAITVEAEDDGPHGATFIDMSWATRYPERIDFVMKEAIKMISDIAQAIGVTDIFVKEIPMDDKGHVVSEGPNPN